MTISFNKRQVFFDFLRLYPFLGFNFLQIDERSTKTQAATASWLKVKLKNK